METKEITTQFILSPPHQKRENFKNIFFIRLLKWISMCE